MEFRDRADAGRRLGGALSHLESAAVLVLGLPRGGVVVGLEVARSLEASLDVLGVRKLGAPGQPEFGIGAIAEGGARVLDDWSVERLGLGEEAIASVEDRERRELERRVRAYRGDTALPDLSGLTVVLVDDGLATGGTARVACRAARRLGAGRLVLAVPVASREGLAALREEADEVVCLLEPPSFMAVGSWYERFDQVDDDQVLEALEEARGWTRR